MLSQISTAACAFHEVPEEEIVPRLFHGIGQSCQKIGTSVEAHAAGEIFWIKPTRDVIRDDDDIVGPGHYEDFRFHGMPEVMSRTTELGDTAGMIRAAVGGWEPIVFLMIQTTRSHGQEVYCDTFEWSASLEEAKRVLGAICVELREVSAAA
jgi:hypothetical protein